MMTRLIATLDNCRSPVSGTHQVTFDELASWFAEPVLGAKDGPAWMPADIEPGPRTSERVKSIGFLVFDVEAQAENVKGEDGKPLIDECGDTIKRVLGPEPPAVDDMLTELALHGRRCCLHTSYSHGGTILPEGVENPRYRLIFDLSRPLTPAELKPLGLHVAGLLELSDCFDAPCLEPARLFYAPRCPTEERKRLYRHALIEGEPLSVDDLLHEAWKIEAAQKSALARQHPPASASVIDAFNAQADIGRILEEQGYIPKGRRRWLFSGSTTGLPGVRMLPDDGRGERAYSSHGGDPLNNGHAHDAFDCWRILQHSSDMSAAVKAAAQMLGLNGAVAARKSTDRAKPQPDGANAPVGECGRDVGLIRASDITPEPIAWLWSGWLAAGKMHVFGGAPGTGKTTISMVLAAIVTTGGNWPDGTSCTAGNVVIWSGEDDPADTLIPRLALSGADLSRVFFIADIREGNERRSFDPARDMEPLRRKLVEIGGARLLIVDPIVSAIAGDSHKNAEVRRGLQPLVDLAASMRCALLGITHFSKGTSGANPVERLTGSLAFGALARVVLVAATHEGGEGGRNLRIFCRAKSNIGPDSGGFAYDLHQAELELHPGIIASAVQWGEAVEGEARDLLSTAEASGGDDHGGALADAKQYLSDLLSDGPLPTKTIKADASDAGHSWATIRRALKVLGCEKSKAGMDGGWAWRLPGHEAAKAILESANLLKKHEDAQQKEVSTFGRVEHLRSDSDGVEG